MKQLFCCFKYERICKTWSGYKSWCVVIKDDHGGMEIYSHSWLSSDQEEGEGRRRPGSRMMKRSGSNDRSKGWWREKSDSSAESVCRVKDGGGDEGIIPCPTSHSEGGKMSAVPGNSSTAQILNQILSSAGLRNKGRKQQSFILQGWRQETRTTEKVKHRFSSFIVVENLWVKVCQSINQCVSENAVFCRFLLNLILFF